MLAKGVNQNTLTMEETYFYHNITLNTEFICFRPIQSLILLVVMETGNQTVYPCIMAILDNFIEDIRLILLDVLLSWGFALGCTPT